MSQTQATGAPKLEGQTAQHWHADHLSNLKIDAFNATWSSIDTTIKVCNLLLSCQYIMIFCFRFVPSDNEYVGWQMKIIRKLSRSIFKLTCTQVLIVG